MAEVDELITSVSRPGIVSGMATFARKISAGLSAWFIGILIAMVGYDTNIAQAGLRQTLHTQHGIAMIFIFLPVILVGLLLFFGYIFPISKKEFAIVQKDIARRKGQEKSAATGEEKKILKRITGFDYDKLWNKEN